jgi:predicted RNA-binding protein with TRAM domain
VRWATGQGCFRIAFVKAQGFLVFIQGLEVDVIAKVVVLQLQEVPNCEAMELGSWL